MFSNWGWKVFLGSLIVLFLFLFRPCTLRKNVSSTPKYRGEIGKCYALIEDKVLYRDAQRRYSFGSLVNREKKEGTPKKHFYAIIPEEFKKNISLIQKSPFQEVIAIAPIGTIIKVKEIFIFNNSALSNRVQVVGETDLPQLQRINIDLSNLFGDSSAEYKPDLDVIKPIACPGKLEKR